MAAIRSCLRDLGIAPGDRVAMTVADGLPAAVSFFGLAPACALAPFNPHYTAAEFDRLFADLRPRALVVAGADPAAAIAAAEARGVPVWRIVAPADDNGWRLDGSPVAPPAPDRPGAPTDVALMLYTSGTTSRPKLVPLTQGNLCASAWAIARTLALTPGDRCLNVMPLFHIHGLVAGLLASLAGEASVVCTPGFSAADFLAWAAATGPTWYTAVPTMHQAVLAHAARQPDAAGRLRFRFVRSSSAALSPQVMEAIERVFAAPVVEAYGMTEASHQMASNPLPPGRRKPGTVGRPAGAAIAIFAEDRAEPRAAGESGEICIRGAGVTAGYLDNPEANAAAFADGWFRTGDQGTIDADGYLTITGRIKELINRGGEKIAPREVDEALLAHPAVASAVAFPIPDPNYGEQVAAAVVLRAGADATPEELQRFAAERLADFKVPRRLVIRDALPTGPTGKIQRIGMAEALGLSLKAAAAVPGEAAADPELEREVARVWCQVLGVAEVPPGAEFLDLGGDSIAALRLVNRLRASLKVEIGMADFLTAATVREQAIVLARARARRA